MTRSNDSHSPAESADHRRLREVLDAYGSDPARWPDGERNGLEALCRDDGIARRMQQDAASLDSLLDAVPDPVPSPALRRAVAEIPIRHATTHATTASASLPWLLQTLRRSLLAATVVTGLGLFAGIMSAQATHSDGSDWNEWTEWVFATPLDDELDL